MVAFTFSVSGESTMRLDVFDLGRVRSSDALCSFRFPVSTSVGPPYTKILIRGEAVSGRTSHPYGSVPFYISQSDRLYVISCTSDFDLEARIVLFVHLSTLLGKIATLPPGTKGHQLITRGHGTKFALIRHQQLEVYDFTKLSVKRDRVRRNNAEQIEPYLSGDEFMQPVYSRLPYDMRTVPIWGPAGISSDRFVSVLLTDDSLILIPVSDEQSMFGKCTRLTGVC
jgi:hypothetical protein